jgi:hypothetical protein
MLTIVDMEGNRVAADCFDETRTRKAGEFPGRGLSEKNILSKVCRAQAGRYKEKP